MAESTKPLVIALEEHYADPAVLAASGGPGGGPPGGRSPISSIFARLADLGEGRLRDMDEAGIDVQVLSRRASVGRHLSRFARR